MTTKFHIHIFFNQHYSISYSRINHFQYRKRYSYEILFILELNNFQLGIQVLFKNKISRIIHTNWEFR